MKHDGIALMTFPRIIEIQTFLIELISKFKFEMTEEAHQIRSVFTSSRSVQSDLIEVCVGK